VSIRRYDFHGVAMQVEADDAAVAEAIDDRLRHFRAHGDGAPDIDVRLWSVPTARDHSLERPPGHGRPVYDPPAGEVTYFPEADQLFIDFERRVRVLADPGASGAQARMRSSSAEQDVWLLSRPLFTLPLVELLKRRGLYSVHAGGVAVDGRAIVLAGASGSGKSTLAVALARAGLDFLADDMVFLSRGADTVRVHSFPDEADLTDGSAAWFPELSARVGRTPRGWPKHRVRVEEVFGAELAPVCAPGLIVLPAISERRESAVTPVAPAAALLELAPNVLLTQPAASQAHLDALGALVASSACYRLEMGRDFARIADMLQSLLAARTH
jgi:hypothetical protein